MILGFGNNVVSSLAADITASQTNISIMPGDGPLFAALLTSDFSNKSTMLKKYAKITLTDSGETAFEVCHLISVSGDTLTVIRGQEGTAAKGWSLKDVIANFSTRGSENAFTQIAHIQSGFYTSGTSGGSANSLMLELPSTFFLNGSTDWELKTPVVVYPSQNNTGAATLQLTMGGRVLGTFPLYKGNKAQLVANDILKDVGLVCLMDKTKTFFNVANPGAIYAGLGTAAFKDVVTSMADATAGRVPVVGWMGLGADGLILKDTDLLSANGVGNAFFVQGGGTDNHFGSYGAGIHLSYGTGGGNTLRLSANLFVDPTGNLSVEWLEINRSDGAIRTQKLQKLYGSLNKPTARDVEAIPYFGQIPAGTNLNTLTNYGVWFNPANANATLALNYPSTQAGSLQILQDAGSTQIYTEYASGRQFRRGLYTGTWNPWRAVYDSLNKPNSDDVNAISRDSCHVAGFINGNKTLPYMRHTASNEVIQLVPIGTADARYIQNTQMGAEEYVDIPYPGQASIPWGACPTAFVGTTKSTGSGISFHISRVYFRRLQKYIGGAWKNVA